ncbi:MAG TPA: DAK2 domain-containing protein [Pseudonocardia sp.]|nr:DAK2 domain-containing protein [Pseudonocardia sp.]
MRVLDASAIRRWADASVDLLDVHRDELDRTNVFPVADGDTGTNLVLTLRAAAEELARRRAPAGRPDTAAEVAAALARGALRGARGNSGVIVSQLPRGLAEVLADAEDWAGYYGTNGSAGGHRPDGTDGDTADGADGPALADALRRADELARAAVSRPVEGTVLSVLRAAATAATAAAARGGALGDVVDAAVEGAVAALADTPRQLPVLARSGVVDAGGQGLVLLLDALAGVVSGRPVDTSLTAAVRGGGLAGQHSRARGSLIADRESGSAEFDYEVMYLLEGSSTGRVELLRARLDELGDSVAVVGDGQPGGTGQWNVHVHCTDIGAAVEAGVEAGRPYRITVVRFADQQSELFGPGADAGRFRLARAVVTVVSGEPIAELVRADGVTALVAAPEQPPGAGEIAAAVAGTRARHVVVLPNDIELTSIAEEAADVARAAGAEVVVVPTSSVLQGLAALAVHDGERRAGDDVVAMAEAAAATRTGVVQIATGEALTWVGRCYAGDVLALVDGEVVLIEHDLAAAACQLADRMLTMGGELVTVLLGENGQGGTDELGELLVGHLRHTHPEVEVVRYRGGPAGRPVQLGVE